MGDEQRGFQEEASPLRERSPSVVLFRPMSVPREGRGQMADGSRHTTEYLGLEVALSSARDRRG